MKKFTYQAILPAQSNEFLVFGFCAKAKDLLEFAKIDRIGRSEDGSLKGFQRPQVSNHINEIRKYLEQDEAVLPNSVVVAFTSGIDVSKSADGKTATVTIENDDSNRGFIVDGQQRLTALSGLPDKEFEVFVSGILCSNEDELRKQFILINNTRPLPKTLIYELLPTVDGLPHRLSSRAAAAGLVEQLNFDEMSSLKGQIKQHTNPTGSIQDTAFQRVIMNSLQDGAMRDFRKDEASENRQFLLLSNFYGAVQQVFSYAWEDHKPRTSRLVHSVGIMATGYVMEFIYAKTKSIEKDSFVPYLEKLVDHCAWIEGTWNFGEGNQRPWNGLQFIPRDYLELGQYLIRQIKSKAINLEREQ